MRRCRLVGLVFVLLLALVPRSGQADGNDLFTLGVGVGVMYSSAPGLDSSSTSFQFSARIKALYFLGIDMMATPAAPEYEAGSGPSTLRLSALLYLVNLQHFAMFGSAGMAATDFSDLFDIKGATTHYRAGGGMEITFAGHYSIGLEGYWVVPGAGIAEDLIVERSLELGRVVEPMEAIPTDGFEMFLGFRYFI